jgi:CRP-like cAMP-binding protein
MASIGSMDQESFSMFSPLKHMTLTPQERSNLVAFERLNSMSWFIEVVKLLPGGTFGELALINKAPRSATVYCLNECWFATLDKQAYRKVLRNIELRKIEAKANFFSKLPFL